MAYSCVSTAYQELLYFPKWEAEVWSFFLKSVLLLSALQENVIPRSEVGSSMVILSQTLGK